MTKKIIAVGIESACFPGDSKGDLIECISYADHRSLGDADIVILAPGPSKYNYNDFGFMDDSKEYRGKMLLSDDDSGRLVDDREFWKKEIAKAVESGKTIFVLSEKSEEFYYATGKKEYSGSGRNRQATSFVNLYNSYDILPIPSNKFHSAPGSEITYRGNSMFRSLWEEKKNIFITKFVMTLIPLSLNLCFFRRKGRMF